MPSVAAVTSCYIDQPGSHNRQAFWKQRGIPDGIVRVNAGLNPMTFTHMVAYMTPCTTVIRKNMALKYGGFYDKEGCRYAEDATLWTKILLNEPVYFHLMPLAVLDRGASSLSSRAMPSST